MIENRSERERERYNDGLQRDSYDRYMNPGKVWFMEDRRKKASGILARAAQGRVLEIGSTTWRAWAEVPGITLNDLTCINVSEAEIETGLAKAKGARNQPKFLLMDAQSLDFEDKRFDVVFGSAILHHIDLNQSLQEIRRVLKPGGVIYFAEPLDMNPIGRVVRALTPKARTEDERPFRMRDLKLMQHYFECQFTFDGLVSVPIGVLSALLRLPSKNIMTRATYSVDRFLGRLPGLQYWCRHVQIEGRAKPN